MQIQLKKIPLAYYYFTLAVLCLSSVFHMSAMEGSEGGSMYRLLTIASLLLWSLSLFKAFISTYKLYFPVYTIIIYSLFFCWGAIPTALAPGATFSDMVYKLSMVLTPMIVLYATYNTTMNYGNSKYLLWFFVLMTLVFVFQYIRVFSKINLFASNHLICSYYTLYMLPIVLLNKSKLLRIIIVIIVTLTLFSSVKRAGVLALAAALLVYLFVNQYVKNKLKVSSILVSILLILSFGGLFFYLGSMGENENDTLLARIENMGQDSGSGRTEVWEKAAKMISRQDADKLLTGNGYNAVLSESPIQKSAHNDFLEVTFDYGVIGLVLYICAFISLGFFVLRIVMSKSQYAPSAAMLYTIYFVLSLVSHIIIYYWANIVMMTFGFIIGLERKDARG